MPNTACSTRRLDPIEDLTRDQYKAVIVVYTEGEIGYANQTRGGPPFRRIVDLIFEISQIVSIPSEGDANRYVAGVPQTDPELEAELDRIETEIAFALFFGPSGEIWRKLTHLMVTDPRSTPHRSSEEGVRLAMRSVCWKCQVPDDLFDLVHYAPLQGLDRLPQPLRGIVEQLRESSYGAVLGRGLAETMPVMPNARKLRGVALNAEVILPGQKRTGQPNLQGEARRRPGEKPEPSRDAE